MKNHLMAYASPYAQHKHTDSKNRASRKRGAEEGPDTTCKLMGRLSISALLHLGSLALQKPLQPSNLQNNNLSTRDLNSQRWSSAGNLLQNEKIKLLLWFSKHCSHVGFQQLPVPTAVPCATPMTWLRFSQDVRGCAGAHRTKSENYLPSWRGTRYLGCCYHWHFSKIHYCRKDALLPWDVSKTGGMQIQLLLCHFNALCLFFKKEKMGKGQDCQTVRESGSFPLPSLESFQLIPAGQKWKEAAVWN